MKIKEIVNALCSLGRRKSDPLIVEAALLYYGAILMNRYHIRKDVKNINSFIVMYVMIFGKSAIGKDFILNQIEKICGLEMYPEQMEKMYKRFLTLEGNQDVDPEILRFLPTSTTVSLEGSKEGLYHVAKSVKLSNFGSVNLYGTEF